jgi:hypothetical protein
MMAKLTIMVQMKESTPAEIINERGQRRADFLNSAQTQS